MRRTVPPQTGAGENIMAIFLCPDCKCRVSTEAEKCPLCGRPVTEKDRHPENKKARPWKWILVCVLVLAVAAVAGWRIHKGYFPRSVDQKELNSTASNYVSNYCYFKLPIPMNKWGRTEAELKWTHCSSDHYEVWVVLDSTIPLEHAETLATELNGYIIRRLKHDFKISELQLKDDKCLVSVFVASKDAGNGERFVYGGTLCSFGGGNGIPRWLNGQEVRSIFSNQVPIDF